MRFFYKFLFEKLNQYLERLILGNILRLINIKILFSKVNVKKIDELKKNDKGFRSG